MLAFLVPKHRHYIHGLIMLSFIFLEHFWSNFKVTPSSIIGSKQNFKYDSSVVRVLDFGSFRDGWLKSQLGLLFFFFFINLAAGCQNSP